jgi:hypothetical protein
MRIDQYQQQQAFGGYAPAPAYGGPPQPQQPQYQQVTLSLKNHTKKNKK